MKELIIDYNNTSHTYEIASENALEECKAFIKSYEHEDLVIKSDDDYRLIYKNRTEINNKAKEIAKTRKQACRTITGNFERACKELEKELNEASCRMTEKLLEYKPREKELIYVLCITSKDKSSMQKIKTIATNWGCEVKEEVI